MVTVTTMSVPQFEPCSAAWETSHPTNPRPMPAARPVQMFCLRYRPPAVGPMGVSSRSAGAKSVVTSMPLSSLLYEGRRLGRGRRGPVGLEPLRELRRGHDRTGRVHEGVVEAAELAAANGEVAE